MRLLLKYQANADREKGRKNNWFITFESQILFQFKANFVCTSWLLVQLVSGV